MSKISKVNKKESKKIAGKPSSASTSAPTAAVEELEGPNEGPMREDFEMAVPQIISSPQEELGEIKSSLSQHQLPPGLNLATEIIQNKLYFAALASHPQSTEQFKYFTIDHDLVYEPFFADFGPLSIGHVVRFCRALKHHLDQLEANENNSSSLLEKETSSFNKKEGGSGLLSNSPKIIFYTSHHGHQRANAGCLIACFCVCVLNMSPAAAWALFDDVYPPFLPFRDASYGVSTYNLTIYDCVCGLYRAVQLKWFHVETFDLEEYDHYTKAQNGDWHWIIPGKMLGFSSPIDVSEQPHLTSVDRVLKSFRDRGVSLVIRLMQERLYDKREFTEVGVRHAELPFADGSTPTDAICNNFLSLCETCPGAIAVHCKAGLGRTGTLIGLYVLKHYALTAKEFIAWARLCRPGSVVGQQQHFLEKMEKRLAREGQIYRRQHHVAIPFMTPTEAWKAKQDVEERMYNEKQVPAQQEVAKLKYASSKEVLHDKRAQISNRQFSNTQVQRRTILKAATTPSLAAGNNTISHPGEGALYSSMIAASTPTPNVNTNDMNFTRNKSATSQRVNTTTPNPIRGNSALSIANPEPGRPVPIGQHRLPRPSSVGSAQEVLRELLPTTKSPVGHALYNPSMSGYFDPNQSAPMSKILMCSTQHQAQMQQASMMTLTANSRNGGAPRFNPSSTASGGNVSLPFVNTTPLSSLGPTPFRTSHSGAFVRPQALSVGCASGNPPLPKALGGSL